MLRSLVSFFVLFSVKVVSRIFFRFDVEWVNEPPPDRWDRLRLVAILHHTSLYEPLLAGAAENRFLWQLARHGVLPVAAKTMRRKVGLFFRLIVNDVVVITRKKDHTWQSVLDKVDDRAVVCILPEGRMMRRTGLDSEGRPMTVRGGIAEILEVIPEGYMFLVYSGGLHHIQAPGELLPRPFKTIRIRLEIVDIRAYREELMAKAGQAGFKRAVIADLEHRRDTLCPTPYDIRELTRRALAARAAEEQGTEERSHS